MKKLTRNHSDDKERAIREEREKLKSFQYEKVHFIISFYLMVMFKDQNFKSLTKILFMKTTDLELRMQLLLLSL